MLTTPAQVGGRDPTACRIVILDGSLGGSGGNTDAVLAALVAHLAPLSQTEIIRLSAQPLFEPELEDSLRRADGFVFASGTYWDSWGSPLQRFFEQSTHLEVSDVWLGKPAAAVVTMHSVGGKGVLSRLQGVLSTLGLMIPPMTGIAYSLACHLALAGAAMDPELADFWQLGDLEVVAHNLLQAARGQRAWRPWLVDSRPAGRRWMPY